MLTSAKSLASKTVFFPTGDIARYSLKLRVIPMRLASAAEKQPMELVQLVAPEDVDLTHNPFWADTVFGQFRFHFFLLL